MKPKLRNPDTELDEMIANSHPIVFFDADSAGDKAPDLSTQQVFDPGSYNGNLFGYQNNIASGMPMEQATRGITQITPKNINPAASGSTPVVSGNTPVVSGKAPVSSDGGSIMNPTSGTGTANQGKYQYTAEPSPGSHGILTRGYEMQNSQIQIPPLPP
jgi:hypothetical protein